MLTLVAGVILAIVAYHAGRWRGHDEQARQFYTLLQRAEDHFTRLRDQGKDPILEIEGGPYSGWAFIVAPRDVRYPHDGSEPGLTDTFCLVGKRNVR